MLNIALILAVAVSFGAAGPLPSHLVGPQPISPQDIYRLQHLGPDERPEFYSGQFEGDIILTQEQFDYINEVQVNPNTVLTDPTVHWPNAVIPYELLPGEFSADDIAKIELALYNIEHFTCMRFVRRTTEANYVSVSGRTSGCWSHVGVIGGAQQLSLGDGCVFFTTVIHEFLHAAGFFHMQSATDRDNFVRVLWQNIEPGMEHNFEKYPSDMISQFGVPYDFTSVMHYGTHYFSVNGQPTLESLTNNEIRPTDTWSWWDIERINNVYCR